MVKSKDYDLIVGLEVHVQLQTQSKLFCGCCTSFGAQPNTQTCPVCTGMPGALPVLNRRALQLAIRTGLALNCEIATFTKWDRKNYFYPDLPKGYQVSQFDLPVCGAGYLAISDPSTRLESRPIRLIRAHLEEDAGKSLHDEAGGLSDTRIDLNRAGTPLLEIVSEPDIRSPLEAKAFLSELKLLLGYLGVSDCNMQEGSLRVDANVNLHVLNDDQLSVATPIVEVKNLNSFRAVERAVTYEAERQWKLWQQDKLTIDQRPKQTRGWNDAEQVTVPQREKEESADYRYFPDPDLVPVVLTADEISEYRADLCELPSEIRLRLQKDYEVSAYDSDVMVNQGRECVQYFEAVAKKTNQGKLAANWVQQHVLEVINDSDCEIEEFPVNVDRLSSLIEKVHAGELDNSRAKDVFQAMLTDPSPLEKVIKALGIENVADDELETICRELLEQNPQIVTDYQGGKKQAIGSLIGQAKKKNPNANPGRVRELLIQIIENT